MGIMIFIGLLARLHGQDDDGGTVSEAGAQVYDPTPKSRPLCLRRGGGRPDRGRLSRGCQGKAVDRERLSQRVLGDPAAWQRLKRHRLAADERREAAFFRRAREEGASVAVLDIPLLLETGGGRDLDAWWWSPLRRRSNASGASAAGMTPAKFEAILAPDARCRKAGESRLRRRDQRGIEHAGGR